jgi:hypothetical protein
VTTVEDPATWDDLFVRDVDERPLQFVRPADTDRPTWAAYDGGTYLGIVSAEPDDGRPLWQVQTTREAHRVLGDTVRAPPCRICGRPDHSRSGNGDSARGHPVAAVEVVVDWAGGCRDRAVVPCRPPYRYRSPGPVVS